MLGTALYEKLEVPKKLPVHAKIKNGLEAGHQGTVQVLVVLFVSVMYFRDRIHR